MNIPHDTFCVLPWVSLEASPIGSVRPCCLAEDEIADDQGQKFDLNSADLTAVQNSQYMTNLRQEFLDGKRPRTCRKCWNEERAGRTSKRMHTLDRLKHMIQDEEWTSQSKPLRFLDLKLGNICNLKCRICGSWSSSTFAAEELKYLGEDQDKKQSYHYQMLRRGAWPLENPGFWSEIDRIIDHISYIEFTGGEPFMIQEHFQLLRRIVDRGQAHQVEIHYNTNGTHFPLGAEEIWQHFKLVEIAFSIDDTGERFEYQRTNAQWLTVLGNLDLFQDMRRRRNNIQLQVCATVSVFNIMYLESLANWIDQQAFDMVYWNVMHEAYYFSIGSMPDSAKQVARQRLTHARVAPTHQMEFERIIRFMEGSASLDGNILRMKVEDLDWRRGQDLRDHHAELAEAISYAGPKR